MSPMKVALAGGTGNLGLPILNGLLAAGYTVTVLSRKGGSSSKLAPHQNLSIHEVDFTLAQSMQPALAGCEVVISCLATLAIGSQNPLIDAAVAMGVKRFIPAEFGMDSANPLAVQLPVCAPKAATQQYLKEKFASNSTFTYTAIANGMFLDWCLDNGLIIDLASHAATLYNGGDVPFSATNLDDVVRAVISVVESQEATENRIVYVQSALVTQNQLIQYAKEIDGQEWTTTVKDTEVLKNESLEELTKGDVASANLGMLGFSYCGMFNGDYGCDFSDRLDNDLLGVKAISEAELRGLIGQHLNRHLL